MPGTDWAETALAYRFADEGLLELALTHRSAASRNNERLEFLGDAVLGVVITHAIFLGRPEAEEGALSRIRARLVRRDTLAEIAQSLDLGVQIRLGSGELRTGGHQRTSTLANALEAVFGAVYLDGGMAAAERVILALFAQRLTQLPGEEELTDAKTRLQEWLQARGHRPPTYAVSTVTGAAHAQTFNVTCAVESFSLEVTGTGASRRAAEQTAAEQAIQQLHAL